jgi:hypothetical protein
VRLLVKKMGRGIPESVFREELESMESVSRESRSCDPGNAIRTPPRTAFPHSLHRVSDARAGGIKSTSTHRTLRFASSVES